MYHERYELWWKGIDKVFNSSQEREKKTWKRRSAYKAHLLIEWTIKTFPHEMNNSFAFIIIIYLLTINNFDKKKKRISSTESNIRLTESDAGKLALKLRLVKRT